MSDQGGDRGHRGGVRTFTKILDEDKFHIFSGLLTRTEERLLQRLAKQDGSPVHPSELAADVWRQEDKQESLRFYIRSLRAKLEPFGLVRILSQKGIGYRLELSAPSGSNGHPG